MSSRRNLRDAALLAARSELPTPEYLDTVQAAAYVGLTRKQMEHLRVRGGGCPYSKIGRHVRYRVADLDAWMASGRVDNSTGVQR